MVNDQAYPQLLGLGTGMKTEIWTFGNKEREMANRFAQKMAIGFGILKCKNYVLGLTKHDYLFDFYFWYTHYLTQKLTTKK